MKIGFVFDDSLDRPDGVQQYIKTLGDYYEGRGHEVHYLVGATTTETNTIHSLSRNLRVGFNANRLSIPVGAKKEDIRRLLAKLKLDVLHVQLPYSPLLSGRIIAAAEPSTAIVGTFHILPHGRLARGGTKLLARLQKKTHRRFDAVMSVSPAAREFALSHYLLSSEVVPNAVPLKRFLGAKPLKSLDDNRLRILFLGRLVPRKGAQWLLKAVELLQQQGELPENVHIVIGGRGPLEGKLRQFSLKKGLSKQVDFAGFIEEADKPSFLAAADIAVFPATGGESFGIVLVEAMAAARGVVIGGDNAGYRSILSSWRKTLFDPKDSAALAQTLRGLLQDASLRRQLHESQAEAAAQYDVDLVGRTVLAIYEKALAQRRQLVNQSTE